MRVVLALPGVGVPADVRVAFDGAVGERHELLAPVAQATPGVTASERNAFLTVLDRMMEAELLVADVSEADAGVGWCVAWFLAKGRLVVLTCRRDARDRLPAMLVGNPSPWQKLVLYDGPADLSAGLAKALAF